MKYLLVIAMLLFVLSEASAGMVKLSWVYDGPDGQGFRLYYGTVSHEGIPEPTADYPEPLPYERVIDIMDSSARTYEMVLPEGEYYFRMVTIGNEKDSVFTQEEPVAYVGINAPSNFKVEWILTTPK